MLTCFGTNHIKGTPKLNNYKAKIGYARTSTTDQSLDAQVSSVKAAGCGVIRTEQKGSICLDGRPEPKTILDFIHTGETLVVSRIDRLARSLGDLQTTFTQMKTNGAHLAATKQPVDTSTATGKAFFDMLGVFAEFETNLRRGLQAEGIAAAKIRGVYRGRIRPKYPIGVERVADRRGFKFTAENVAMYLCTSGE